MLIRQLTNDDLELINQILLEQGLTSIPYVKNSWILYGCIANDKLVSIAGLFIYDRFPHADYPTGHVAEIGGVYTSPKYRRRGIMKALLKELIDQAEGIDCIVSDTKPEAVGIFAELDFIMVDNEFRMWLPKERLTTCHI